MEFREVGFGEGCGFGLWTHLRRDHGNVGARGECRPRRYVHVCSLFFLFCCWTSGDVVCVEGEIIKTVQLIVNAVKRSILLQIGSCLVPRQNISRCFPSRAIIVSFEDRAKLCVYV